MLSRFVPTPLLVSLALLVGHAALAGAPAIELVVPSFVFPGSTTSYTQANAISNTGITAGVFASSRTNAAGFIRMPNGKFGPPIIPQGASVTTAFGVNSAGIVSGTFSSNADHGFFYDHGSLTQYDVPGAVHTNVTGINDSGDFCGFFFNDGALITPFLNVNGTLIPFNLPGVNVIYPRAINNLGQVVGIYTDPVDPSVEHGFFRDSDGSVTYPLDFPNGRDTAILGINDRGVLVGGWRDTSFIFHAFLLQLPNRFLSYDYPAGEYSTFTGINNSGLISGSALSNESYHSFIARIAR